MARNRILVPAPRESVYAVLADPRSYPGWVPEAREVRAADPHWPSAGTSFYPRSGIGPLRVPGRTRVRAVREPSQLVLEARVGLLPPARITLELEAIGAEETRLTMTETPDSGVLALLIGPLGHGALWARNALALRRLRSLVERQA